MSSAAVVISALRVKTACLDTSEDPRIKGSSSHHTGTKSSQSVSFRVCQEAEHPGETGREGGWGGGGGGGGGTEK